MSWHDRLYLNLLSWTPRLAVAPMPAQVWAGFLVWVVVGFGVWASQRAGDNTWVVVPLLVLGAVYVSVLLARYASIAHRAPRIIVLVRPEGVESAVADQIEELLESLRRSIPVEAGIEYLPVHLPASDWEKAQRVRMRYRADAVLYGGKIRSDMTRGFWLSIEDRSDTVHVEGLLAEEVVGVASTSDLRIPFAAIDSTPEAFSRFGTTVASVVRLAEVVRANAAEPAVSARELESLRVSTSDVGGLVGDLLAIVATYGVRTPGSADIIELERRLTSEQASAPLLRTVAFRKLDFVRSHPAVAGDDDRAIALEWLGRALNAPYDNKPGLTRYQYVMTLWSDGVASTPEGVEILEKLVGTRGSPYQRCWYVARQIGAYYFGNAGGPLCACCGANHRDFGRAAFWYGRAIAWRPRRFATRIGEGHLDFRFGDAVPPVMFANFADALVQNGSNVRSRVVRWRVGRLRRSYLRIAQRRLRQREYYYAAQFGQWVLVSGAEEPVDSLGVRAKKVLVAVEQAVGQP